MAYGAIAYAAAKSGNQDLARTASDWLVQNSYERPDGHGWGLSFSWDAFSDGTENPRNTIYGITVAFATQGLLETFKLTNDDQYIDSAESALDYYIREASSVFDDRLIFRYSDQNPDHQYDVYNIGAYLAGQYAVAGELMARDDFQQASELAVASTLQNQRLFENGESVYWPYSDHNSNNPNDALHAAFIVSGLAIAGVSDETVRDAGRYLDLFWTDNELWKWPSGHSAEEMPYTPRVEASAWDLAGLLFAYCSIGENEKARNLLDRHGYLFSIDDLEIRELSQALMAYAECGFR